MIIFIISYCQARPFPEIRELLISDTIFSKVVIERVFDYDDIKLEKLENFIKNIFTP
jgi:hypothetical protein